MTALPRRASPTLGCCGPGPAPHRQRSASADDGAALVAVLLAITLVAALAAALTMTTTTEGKVSANYRDGIEALYAADAGIERAFVDVAAAADSNALLDGRTRSAFVDGPPAGLRAIAGGASLDLSTETNVLRCGHAAPCSEAEMDAITELRPWGANNPRWQLYAYGPLAELAPGTIDSRFYIAAWVADDAIENDDEPLRDGGPPAPGRSGANPGGGTIVIRARSYGPGGVSRIIEALVARGPRGIRLVSWRTVD
jgi:hypothetical protein